MENVPQPEVQAMEEDDSNKEEKPLQSSPLSSEESAMS